ncbi:MAG TPA: ATP-binding cassette domain-containing protein [Candidatus Acidoferrales bacterium]|nr:ATP-binding cassette domain-containing protein [Candidatus Acidoferrales bacterium]
MSARPAKPPVLLARGLRKFFRRETGAVIKALDGVSLDVLPATLTAVVGPDGAGKTTLMRLAAGLIFPDEGELRVLSVDVAKDAEQVQERIGYMPQRFGLYEDLSVQENLDLYADLHGVSAAARRERYPRLLEMTALEPFTRRLAGQLSGGMKQKLGLACALVHTPELLLLDEPTVGVDPLSRRELWEIILQLVREQGLSVILSTSYLDEAERCARVIVLHEGRMLAQGDPAEVTRLAAERTFIARPPHGESARGLQARLLDDAAIVDAVPEGGRVRLVRAALEGRQGEEEARNEGEAALAGLDTAAVEPRFEDGFMVLLRSFSPSRPLRAAASSLLPPTPSPPLPASPPVVQVRNLVRRFGAFTAVDHVSFDVHRGTIFGLLGPNGAGKTTTFRMLCGLLPATAGTLSVAGVDLRRARASARQRIGYVAQKFSLYSQLSVVENLDFFASAYALTGARKRARVAWALREFELSDHARLPAGQLPGGYNQRLAMAAALMHEPETLFLDEPTSGVDPLARREFWRRITALAARGITVIITTHFMEEAEYCDRVAIMDAGQILAQGTPAEIRQAAPALSGREPTMEDAFIAIVENARARNSRQSAAAGDG